MNAQQQADAPLLITTRALLARSPKLLPGLVLLIALMIIGAVTVDGFTNSANVKSMLLLASFLGIAAYGQTLCALVGGIDLSIPFLIGAANVLLVWFLGKGLSPGLAIAAVLALAALIGLLSATISKAVRVHSLIVTLGVGFVVIGVAQIVTTAGSEFAGNVYGTPPAWLTEMTSLRSTTLGIGVPPVVALWLVLSIAGITFLRMTTFGRGIYAMGGNPVAAERVGVSVNTTWLVVFMLSAVFAALTGVLLVGFSGGGVVSVGEPYLFTTIAAVVVGGSSLLGGQGGYGLTLLGVAVLTVLQTVLVGLGLSPPGQETVLGLMIIATVALYAREPHPRSRI